MRWRWRAASSRGLNLRKPETVELQTPEAPALTRTRSWASCPADLRTPYDIREVIARTVDGSRFSEFKARFGQTLVTGFAHIEGMPCGIIANNGILYSESAAKGAHFIELLRPAQNPAGVFAEHHRFHGGPEV